VFQEQDLIQNTYLITGKGYITTEQLREILWELDNSTPASDMDKIIDEIDSDNSGTVDFEGKHTELIILIASILY